MVKLPPIINHAYLMVTEYCPLRCEYCYIKNRHIKNEFPFEWVEKIKNMFTCYNKPRLIFFGGEPLTKIDLIEKIVNEYKDDFQFQVVTNGMVKLSEFMERVYEPNRNNFDVQISWDGNMNTRPMANGLTTKEQVYDNIVNELEKGRIFEGRCVLNDQSVKHFYETYMTFKRLHSKYKFGGDFTIAHQPTFSDSFHINLGMDLDIIYEIIKSDLFNEDLFIPRFLLKTITNVIQNKPVISCDIGTHIVIKPNGDVYPCTILSQQDERFKLGNINKQIDTEVITDLRYEAKCQKDCAFKSICDGGCRYERIKNFPNDWKCNICNHTCEIYESIYNSTQKFLESLTDEESKQLYYIINQYNMWKIDYDNGIKTNNQERLI